VRLEVAKIEDEGSSRMSTTLSSDNFGKGEEGKPVKYSPLLPLSTNTRIDVIIETELESRASRRRSRSAREP